MPMNPMNPGPVAPAGPAAGSMAPTAPSDGMDPSAAPQASEAEQTQVAVENLNVAQAAAMEALSAAQTNTMVPPETEQKIEQAVVLLDEAKNEIAAPAATPQDVVNNQALGSGAEV